MGVFDKSPETFSVAKRLSSEQVWMEEYHIRNVEMMSFLCRELVYSTVLIFKINGGVWRQL